MARAGMLHRGGKNGADGGDDVQRSLELLDKVLSEFDEGEPRSLDSAAPPDSAAHTPATPDDDSPSLAGHQSEDDGYMSMNGRRAKFALGFRPTDEREESEAGDTPLSPPRSALAAPAEPASPAAPAAPGAPLSPPPPEEAQRIISTLLPKVSPANSAKRNASKIEEQRPPESEKFDSIISINGTTTATQTTLPKTRHQRPYGWEKGCDAPGFQLQPPPAPPCRFASLPYGARPGPHAPPAWLPPRPHDAKRSPSLDGPPVFPLVGVCDKPYNEHPVTIYPGPARQFNRLHSPTYLLQRVPPYNPKPGCRTPDAARNAVKPDERIEAALSPKSKIPPRTLAGSMERHREVCRGSMDDAEGDSQTRRSSKNNDEDHFSDDSLEESFPPPPPAVTSPSKRNSIAWEVSLDIDDPLLTPGSTKVIGRRRRKSVDNSQSSSSSTPQRLDDGEWPAEEYWPPPPAASSPSPSPSTSPERARAAADSDTESDPRLPPDLNSTGTYVIRKGKNRKQLPAFAKTTGKPVRSSNLNRYGLNRSLDADRSIDGPSASMSGSGLSHSHNPMSSYGSRPSSDVSATRVPARRAADLNPRLSRELHVPGSRYSIDLGAPNARIAKEIASPKSRLSLDLNDSQDRRVALEYLGHSPKSFKPNGDRAVPHAVQIVPNKLSPQNRFTDFKKYSSTFDNIRSLMKEGKMEECEPSEFETVCELTAAGAPGVVRVVSLPSLANDKDGGCGADGASRAALITTVEEEDDQESAEPNSSEEASPLRKIENNISAILSQGRDQKLFTPYVPKDWNIHRDEYCDDISSDILEKSARYSWRERQQRPDIQKSSSHNEIGSQRSRERAGAGSARRHRSKETSSLARQPSSSDSAVSSGGDFPVNVQIVEHAYRGHAPPSPGALELGPLPQTPESPGFPPLPPSPVQEVDDEYSEIMQPREKLHTRADTLPTPGVDLRHRSSELPGPPGPPVPPHRDSTGSLKTRSMEAGYSKHKRGANLKSGSTDRRTLPTDMAASGVRRRTLQRQGREATPPGARTLAPLQTSASLPETPIFARGCDVPRTPLRHTSAGLAPRQSSTMNSIQTMGGSSTLGGYGRGSASGTGVDRALAGAELLRLAGGPARGWYPRQRHRPASTEHLDRLTASSKCAAHEGGAWEGAAARKPLTLPPNLTPKFFQRSPREALRRVTSLLIRKGNNVKEKEPARGKEATSPAARSVSGNNGKEKEPVRWKEITSPAARSVRAGEDHPGQKQRKGFFKSLWKRSRHYSLEQP